MSNFVTCKIIELNDHPQANKLKVAKVTDGKNTYSVVCGAKNIRLDMISILAKIGAKTVTGTVIQESTIRGVPSSGMLCSPLELGVSQEQGIVDLPPKTAVGTSLESIDKNQLSSIAWWDYTLVERFYFDPSTKAIQVHRDQFDKSFEKFKLVSETYWSNGAYHYRQF